MVDEYMAAGYMPHAGCNLKAATEWVLFHIRLMEPLATVSYKDAECRFYMSIMGMEIPTDWFWENNKLLRKIEN